MHRASPDVYDERGPFLGLGALGKSQDDAAVEWLVRVLEEEQGELAPAAAEALGATGNPSPSGR